MKVALDVFQADLARQPPSTAIVQPLTWPEAAAVPRLFLTGKILRYLNRLIGT